MIAPIATCPLDLPMYAARYPRHAGLAIAAFLLLPCGVVFAELSPGEARVAVPVADLRKEPAPPGPAPEHDPLQESQLLHGDRVLVLEVRGEWARVSAPEQQEWTHNRRWEGYPGWVRVSDLAQGTGRWTPAETAGADARKEIVKAARGMLGIPYYWGGRSPPDPEAPAPPHRGVDCSGLTGLAHQAAGVNIPRDAHEQWMKARPVTRETLQPGDLVFLADPEDAHRITHVMMYSGDSRVIEGPGTGSVVREVLLDEKLKEAAGRRVYYGSYL